MTYPLRDVPEALWKRVKQTAASRGHSIRYVLLRLLDAYVDEPSDLIQRRPDKREKGR